MQKLSIKKFSVLSLVLLGASAVTAAFVSKPSAGTDNGILQNASNDAGIVKTCVPADSGQRNCTATASSLAVSTNANPAAQSTVTTIGGRRHQTVGNTSQTAIAPGDQTSATQVLAK